MVKLAHKKLKYPPISPCTKRTTALNHEVFNDAVKNEAVEVRTGNFLAAFVVKFFFTFGELDEILYCFRRCFRKQFDVNDTLAGSHHDNGIGSFYFF